MIFVTGATGQLGSCLLYELTRAGKTVRALYRDKNKIETVKRLFSFFHPEPVELLQQIEWVKGDVNDYFTMSECIRDVEWVFHTAGMISFNNRYKRKLHYVNIDGTANIVNACLEKGNIRLIHVSSIASLGENANNDIVDENLIWDQGSSASAYSISKFKGEMQVWRGIFEGLDAVIVNPSVIIGPMMSIGPGSSIFKSSLKGLNYYPAGTSGYIDARDVAGIMVRLAESDIKGERFIISAGNFSHRHILDLLAEALNKPQPKYPLTPMISKTAAFAECLRASITGTDARVDNQSFRTANQQLYFSNEKISKALNVNYTSIEESIKTAVAFYNFFYAPGVTF